MKSNTPGTLFDENSDPTRIHDVTGGAHAHQRRNRSDDGTAFLPDPYQESKHASARVLRDDFAEDLAENYLAGATTGGSADPTEALDAVTDEEEGGPFLEEADSREYASGTDGNNPADATREPFPSPIRGGRG